MVTTARLGSVTVMRLGRDDGLIVRLKCSSFSNTSSSLIGTAKDTLVAPAEIVTLYGPET